MCESWFAIQVEGWTPRRLIAYSRRSTRPSPAEWGWGLQAVERLSRGWADSSGLARMSPGAPSLNSAYPSNKRAHRRSEHFTLPTQVQGSRCIAVHESATVKVFGCRPLTEGWRAHGRPASENLQGRKPREGRRGRFVARYGDLSAANAARD